jgi:hypothetical protein
LNSIADGEDWKATAFALFEQGPVDGFAGGVGLRGCRIKFCPIASGGNICGAAGKQDARASTHKLANRALTAIEFDGDRLAAGTLDRGRVHRPGAVIVGFIAAGGHGDGDARAGHVSIFAL